MELKKSQKADLENKKSLFFQIGLVVSLAAVLIAFEWKSRPNKDVVDMGAKDMFVEEDQIAVTRQETPPPPPPPAPQQQIAEILEVVEDNATIENEAAPVDVESKQTDVVEAPPVVQQEEEESAAEEVFVVVEDPPLFNGEKPEVGFRKYIQENLKYPTIAAENGIQGRVMVQFTVNRKGEVVNATVVRGIDPSLDKEALRVVMASPKWTPGKQRGRTVSVLYTFPIVFVLQ